MTEFIRFYQYLNWFKNFIIRLDLGYLGIQKDYVCKEVFIPEKSSKLHKLLDDEKLSNKDKAKDRIA
ncbi:MAG: hypothetical protein H7263_02030 [Candidatus Sericytochromatia bacterium]|nr:hypothetical protein [Candidatus Sericytochromatia bacterium]